MIGEQYEYFIFQITVIVIDIDGEIREVYFETADLHWEINYEVEVTGEI